MYELREYQQEALDRIEGEFIFGSNELCLYAHTGWGKSVLIADFAYNEYKEGKTVMIIMNLTVLAKQLYDTIKTHFGIEPTFLQGNNSEIKNSRIIIAMEQTIISRKPDYKIDTLIKDEFHRSYKTKTWNEIIDLYRPNKILGLTATPYNADGKWLIEKDNIIETVSIKELELQKFLTPIKYYKILTTNKIYKESEKKGEKGYLSENDSYTLTKDHWKSALSEIMKEMDLNKEKSLIFVSSIVLTEEVSKWLIDNGINAKHIHSDMSQKEAEKIIKEYRDNKISSLVSVSKISTGFDVADITLGIDLKPTMSKIVFIQAIGRVMRINEGKNEAKWIDCVGNVNRFGFHWLEHFSTEELNDDKNKKAKETKDIINGIKLIEDVGSFDEEIVKVKIEEFNELKRGEYRELDLNRLLNFYDSLYYYNSNIEELLTVGSLIYKKLGIVTKESTLNWIITNVETYMKKLDNILDIDDSKYYRFKYDFIYRKIFNSYKTRIKNIIKERKKYASLKFFIEWLFEKDTDIQNFLNYELENEINEYEIMEMEDIPY